MTSEQLEKAMQFILDQQAKAEARQAEHEAKLAEYERKNELEKKELRDNIQSLTNAVGVLAIQADKDRDEIKVAINQMGATATAINNAVVRLEVKTEKDRDDTKLRLDSLEQQAEKDRQVMTSAVDKLVNSISNVHKRVSHLEDKAS